MENNKTKKSTKVAAIVILSFVFAISLFILISSLATVNLNPKFVGRPDKIDVYQANASVPSGQITKDDELYEKFMGYYDNMFASSFLSALFGGRLGGYEVNISLDNNVQSSSKIYSKFESTFVRFAYDDEIALTYKSGAECKRANNSSQTFTFKELYFGVDDTNGLSDFKIYAIDYSSSLSSGKTYYAEIDLKANTYDLSQSFKDFYNSIVG